MQIITGMNLRAVVFVAADLGMRDTLLGVKMRKYANDQESWHGVWPFYSLQRRRRPDQHKWAGVNCDTEKDRTEMDAQRTIEMREQGRLVDGQVVADSVCVGCRSSGQLR